MRLLMARYGLTPLNIQWRFTGQLDIPLRPLGQRQAEMLGYHLAHGRY